ncbi:hypothetical protein [Novosphingobium colocasiae]|uniref:hypothetical protein n=1 Tax=Novosphingobium colocasiae TaxID=1256513 RepID=UPI0035AFEFC4
MALKFSMILEAIDRASAPARRARASMAGLTSGVRAWGQQVRKVSTDIQSGARSIDFYRVRAERLRRVALGRFFQAAGNDARRFAQNLRAGIRSLDLMGRAGRGAMAGLKSLGSGMVGGIANLATWGATAAAAAGTYALFDMFRKAGQFEQYQVQMEINLGSAAKAKEAMRWIQNFAQSTPFELDQVTEAFGVLTNAGLDPVNGLLRATGDAAAGMSSDIVEAAKAVADASNGQFERLIDLGITASTKGDQVSLSWVKNGKQIEKVAQKTDKVALAMAVAAAWSDKFAGSSDRQSKTLFGIISNLKDKWSGFQLMIANAGIFDKVKSKLGGWLDAMGDITKNRAAQEWAKSISDGLGEAFDWATNLVQKVRWRQLAADLGNIANAAWSLAKWTAAAVVAIQRFQANRIAGQNEIIEGGWFTSKEAKNKARKERQKLEAQYGPLTSTGQREADEKAAAQKSWSKKYYRRTLNGPDIPIGKGLLGPKVSTAPTQVGGRLAVDINVRGPGTARVTEIKSANPHVPIRANTGKIMAGAA